MAGWFFLASLVAVHAHASPDKASNKAGCEIIALSGDPVLPPAKALVGRYRRQEGVGPNNRSYYRWQGNVPMFMYYDGDGAWLVCNTVGAPYETCKNDTLQSVLRAVDTAATPGAISSPWFGWDGSKPVELPSVKASCVITLCTGTSAALPVSQCNAWIAMYDATGGPSWSPYCATNRLTPCDCKGDGAKGVPTPVCNDAGDAIESMCVQCPAKQQLDNQQQPLNCLHVFR
jgi:hypothetical protein